MCVGDEEIFREFLVESTENLDQLDRDFVALESDPGAKDRIAAIFRAIHTIKGTSGFLGLPKLEKLAHAGVSGRHTRGCVVLERPDLVKELVVKHGAHDTTARGTAMAELEAMTPRFSQWLPGEEVPEKHWMYACPKSIGSMISAPIGNVSHDAEAKARRSEIKAGPTASVWTGTLRTAQPIVK